MTAPCVCQSVSHIMSLWQCTLPKWRLIGTTVADCMAHLVACWLWTCSVRVWDMQPMAIWLGGTLTVCIKTITKQKIRILFLSSSISPRKISNEHPDSHANPNRFAWQQRKRIFAVTGVASIICYWNWFGVAAQGLHNRANSSWLMCISSAVQQQACCR